MKDSDKRVKLIVNLNYSVIICAVGFFVMIVLAILPYIAFSSTSKIFEIIWVIIGSLFAIAFLIGAIVSYQTAVLDESGIIFRVAIWQIAKVNWNEIVKLDVQDLTTLYSNVRTISVKWIVLHTALNQEAKHGGGNAKNKPPYQIKYCEKNANILMDFCKKYRPDLNTKIFLSVLQKK